MSDFEELDSVSESVLKDIIDHPTSPYWKERFSNSSEVKKLWSAFEELEAGKYITYQSFDNFPAIIRVLSRGETYFKDNKKRPQKRKNEKDNKIVEKVLKYILWCIGSVIIPIILEIIITRIFT